VNEVGLLAMNAGDLATAGEYLALAIRRYRDASETASLAACLRNLAECLGHLGQTAPGQDAAAKAIACAETVDDWTEISAAHSYMGRLADLAGDVAEAEQQFLDADADADADAADAAVRLAARHQLAWCELDALRAHALLDQAEGVNRGWAAKADALYTRLVPPGLDPDPLGTVERLVAAQKAAEAAEESED
jgi:tetratricopeptide (TPR) repeat protein